MVEGPLALPAVALELLPMASPTLSSVLLLVTRMLIDCLLLLLWRLLLLLGLPVSSSSPRWSLLLSPSVVPPATEKLFGLGNLSFVRQGRETGKAWQELLHVVQVDPIIIFKLAFHHQF